MQGLRTPAYVSREVGAAELCISTDTWDAMVKAGKLPPPVKVGINDSTPRWRWEDVDATLCGRMKTGNAGPEPFFREAASGESKERRRGSA